MWSTVVFGLVALAFSLFYGAKACDIFDVQVEGKSLAWKAHQFWLNFLGSLVGWFALWALVPRAAPCLLQSCHLDLTLGDLALFFLAFVGVTGFLPVTIVGLVDSVKQVAAKLAGLLK